VSPIPMAPPSRSLPCRPTKRASKSYFATCSKSIGTRLPSARRSRARPGRCARRTRRRHIGILDGYLTVAFGVSHFHLCIGPHKGPPSNPTPQELARHRGTARAELYRRLDKSGAPVSWGLRLFNGHNEQQATILLPNPFLSPDADKVLKTPDWSRLDLWDRLRARWLGLTEPDPLDRSGRGFSHG
jgi:hypothetical protein